MVQRRPPCRLRFGQLSRRPGGSVGGDLRLPMIGIGSHKRGLVVEVATPELPLRTGRGTLLWRASFTWQV